ncbi:MAG: hypothetical protein LBC18_15300 [Opitutaceae bacterium]|jgi:hypothetical protein|nr:hypothetical protein [Opitutaceae bacterium]
MQRHAAPPAAKHRPGLLPASGAALLAALVLLLSLAGSSPRFHAWLHSPAAECPAHAHGARGPAHGAPATTHGTSAPDAHGAPDAPGAPAHGAPDGDHACAVTLFAQGVHLAAALAASAPVAVAFHAAAPAAPRENHPVAPPHLRPPAHAPPKAAPVPV